MSASDILDLAPLPSSSILFIPLYLVFVAAASYGVVALVTWFPLRQFPGPRLASISELWLAKAIYNGNMGETFVKVNNKYGRLSSFFTGVPLLIFVSSGHLTRVGPRDLMTDDADTIRYISDPKKSGFLRSDWYSSTTLGRFGSSCCKRAVLMTALDPEFHHILSTPDMEYHDKLKLQMTPGVSPLMLSMPNCVKRCL